ncbi:response regulator [Saccharibacillus sp. CPCC 101409]|uniref:response regulator n=1 Tax=Saccharibacillus sp. CPCC 101409 TaxID=3058041 RepID=UPI0026720163|nr:response regulator [Saccharibacillus sp. CPCC 101409]MDO3408927.1 response regulator [Saccharibacillus sp. CPCC 101409]
MYRVLLVDDEPLVHHYQWTRTDWSSHGFEVCGEAYSGPMALELIERCRPHIAIVDVNMPGMNGVELQRTIHERYPAVKTIMLSSYDDYDYVRECLQNGAVDYLLKHRLTSESLIAILNKAAGQIRRESGSADAGPAAAGGAGEPNAEPLREHLVGALLGRPGALRNLEDGVRQRGVFADAVCYAAAAVQIVPFRLLTESRSDMQMNSLVRQAAELTQQSLGDASGRLAAYVENGRLAVVFSFRERSERDAAGEASRLMSNIGHSLELFLNLKCAFAVGGICGGLSGLEASYRAAERAIDVPSASTQSGAPLSGPDRFSLTIEEQKQLLLSVERLDKQEVRRLIDGIFASISKHPVHSRTVQMIASELAAIGEKALPPEASPPDEPPLPLREELSRIGGMAALEQWIQNYFDRLLERLRSRRASGPYSRHVSQTILLILERYPGYITLELAADAIGLNPSYLSRIFKEETGATFSEYLNRVRIEAGCKLLESGRYTVKEVSGQVGFSTYNYFFKVFKEWTGTTPHAYTHRPGGAGQSVK